MNFIELTHANKLEKISVVDDQVAFIYFSPAHDATFVVASGGAIVPVKETKEQIINLLKGETEK